MCILCYTRQNVATWCPLHTFGVVPTASPSFGPLGKFLFFLRRAPLLRRLPWSTPYPCHIPQTDQQSGLHFLFWVFLLGPAGLGLCNNYIVSVVVHLHVCQPPPGLWGEHWEGLGSSPQEPPNPSVDRWWMGLLEPMTHIPWGHFRMLPALEREVSSMKWTVIELPVQWHKYQRTWV